MGLVYTMPLGWLGNNLVVTNDYKHIVDNFNQSEEDFINVYGRALQLNNANGDTAYIIYVEDINNISVICHEVSHIVTYVIREYDISDEDEFRAYLMQYIVDSIINIKENESD